MKQRRSRSNCNPECFVRKWSMFTCSAFKLHMQIKNANAELCKKGEKVGPCGNDQTESINRSLHMWSHAGYMKPIYWRKKWSQMKTIMCPKHTCALNFCRGFLTWIWGNASCKYSVPVSPFLHSCRYVGYIILLPWFSEYVKQTCMKTPQKIHW